MKEIHVSALEELVAELCVKANTQLPEDLRESLRQAERAEKNQLGKAILGDITANFDFAGEKGLPICQDTGMAVVFLEVGQEVHFTGGGVIDAINAGVRKGYLEGKLRCSVVRDPIRRGNTGDNTPAIVHTKLVEGDEVRVVVAPKGFGSENMSRMKMFTPAASQKDIEDFIISCVKEGGSNPCPPVVVGVGLGGDFESCALAAKEALCRAVSQANDDPFYREMEERLLGRINELDIGPQGFGGTATALKVAIEARPTHIAGLPCAVNMGCHVTRHAEGKL